MKILVFGATGALGQVVARTAIERGHTVTLHVRNVQRLQGDLREEDSSSRDRIRIVTGTLDDVDSLRSAIASQDAILSALGPSIMWGSKGAIPDGYRNILAVMREHGVRRIIALSTPDIYHPQDRASFKRALAYYLVSLVGRPAQRELQEVGSIFESDAAEGIDWTVYRVGMLLGSGHDQEVRADWVGVPDYGLLLRHRDCARWMVEEVERGRESQWIRGMPAVWSTGKPIAS